MHIVARIAAIRIKYNGILLNKEYYTGMFLFNSYKMNCS